MTRNDTIASLAVNSWINRNRVVWPECDLSDAELRGCDLTGADLDWASLTECDLTGAKVAFGGRTFTLTEETER
jgi:uncharacterized protein YjbI with pentapeptide repeats